LQFKKIQTKQTNKCKNKNNKIFDQDTKYLKKTNKKNKLTFPLDLKQDVDAHNFTLIYAFSFLIQQ